MNQNIPIDMPIPIKGTRLNLLTPEDKDFSNTEAFDKYFRMFSQQKQFTSTMAPFASRNYGPEWFRRKFPPIIREEESESHAIWFNFLKPTLISARLTA